MIAIKGLTMPKYCTKCPYIVTSWENGRCRAKSQQGKNIPISFIQSRRKPKWCPLLEISDSPIIRIVKEGEQDGLFDFKYTGGVE